MNERMDERMDEMMRMIKSLIAEMLMNQNQSTTGGVEKEEKAAVLIQAFLRTTVVRVKVEQEEKAAVIIQAFMRTTLVRVRLRVRLERRNWYCSIMT